MNSEFDTSVTGEEVVRDDAGDVERLKTKHFGGSDRFWTVIEVDDRAEFSSFSPVKSDGRTPKSTKKISLFDQHRVPMADFEKVAALLASAAKYARDVHDLDVRRAIYIDRYREGDRR